MVDEQNSLQGRIARYVRVGGAVGGLAARVAGERFLGLKLNQDDHAAELRLALGGLKGPLMKVAQILSTIPDALPEAYVQELSQLQSDAPSMGWPFVKRRMAAELGPAWRGKFGDFDQTAVSAASLGQVHRATHTDGRPLACKLQYPDMQSAVEADLRQLKLLFAIHGRYDSTIGTDRIHEEISERLREELDYDREAKHLRLYRTMLAGQPDIHVPEPIKELSTKRLLTMSWEGGERIMAFKDASQEVRNRLALSLFRAWYLPFYRYGVIHGDPHMGNYTVRPDLGVNLLDFGAVRIFPPSFVAAVLSLYEAIRDDDEAKAVHAYEAWGFRGITKATVDVLNIWARFVYAPLLTDQVMALDQTNGTRYGQAAATKVHAALREVGGVEIPRPFVFMDRAAIGLGSAFLHLGAELNWRRAFLELAGDFDSQAMAERQRHVLAGEDLPPPV